MYFNEKMVMPVTGITIAPFGRSHKSQQQA
jgi:hypothetical protein